MAALMHRFGVGESLIGDLLEQHRGGRSTTWLWRQAVIAVAARVASAVRSDSAAVGVAAVVVAVAFALPYLWMHSLTHYAVLLHAAWYPRAFNWLARSSPHALWEIVVFLHLWDWDGVIMWSAMLCGLTWCFVRVWPSRAPVIVAMFTLANVSQRLPYLGQSFLDWWHEPSNPVWISNVAWFAFVTFVAIPVSIRSAARPETRS